MTGLRAVETWNWSNFCGHGEDIGSWSGNDFGHCFEQVALLAPAHALLAIVSTYHLGRCRRNLRGSTLYVNWTWFLILRLISVIFLLISPALQVVFLVSLEDKPASSAEVVVVTVSILTWLLHSVYVWNLRYLHSHSLRGPVSVLVTFFLVVAGCAIHVHTVIVRHISHPSYYSAAEEYATYVNAALCLIYTVSVLPNKQRIYRSSLEFHVNQNSEESDPLTWESSRSYNTLDITSPNVVVTAEKGVNCLSWITFQWVQALMTKGAKMGISNVDDLYLLPERLNTHRVEVFFEKVLQKLMKESQSVPDSQAARMDSYPGLSRDNAGMPTSGDKGVLDISVSASTLGNNDKDVSDIDPSTSISKNMDNNLPDISPSTSISKNTDNNLPDLSPSTSISRNTDNNLPDLSPSTSISENSDENLTQVKVSAPTTESFMNKECASGYQSSSSIAPGNGQIFDSDYDVTDFSNNPDCGRTSRKRVSLFKALVTAFGLEYFSLGILKFLADCLGFAGPILLNYLVDFIESKSEQIYKGYVFAAGLFLSTLLSTVCSTQFDYNVQVVALKIKCALITTIYRKSLTVNSVVQAKFTTGEIVNFMSTDTDRILNFCPSFHAFWSLPFQVGVALFLLYQQLGLSFLSGVAFAVLLIPINRLIAKKIGVLSKKMMTRKDERVKLMNELLYGIRVVKFYSWENHFTNCIREMRDQELKYLKGRKYLDALCVYFWATTPVLISILTFTTHVLMGNKLTAAKVFTSLSLFLMLISPLNAFPWVINGLVEAWVSLKRVHKFVCLKDSDLQQNYSSKEDSDDGLSVHMKNAHFTWRGANTEDSDSINSLAMKTKNESSSQSSSVAVSRAETQGLYNICLRVKKGQFIGVVGKVGSGKSSLFSAIIGDMNLTRGEISVDDLEKGFALVAQEPWIQHATVRDNILFGRPFNGLKYDSVLKACALVEDLKMMPSGDMTEIGENGITLSGGQRSRISLARAVYQDKELYLLDDPLSAVDARVAKHIYNKCIMGLLRSKTRILCTHHVKYLKMADWVVVMEDGRIVQSGPPHHVLPSIQLDLEHHHDQRNTSESEEDGEREEEREDNLMQEEERQKGAVKGHVYKGYWKAVGVCLSPLVLLSLFLMQATRNTSDWWLSYWVSHSYSNESANSAADSDASLLTLLIRQALGNLTSTEDNLTLYLGVYGGLAGANSVFTFARAFLFAYGGVCAATVVHQRLLSAVLKAPLCFFDTTPIGRIVNRFSSDLYAVDDSLPFTLNILLAQAFGILGTLVVTCYGLPWFAVCLVPMAAVYYKIQNYYRHTSRELKRLSSVSLSPIYAHFSETITGLATIRAMRHSKRFCEENKQFLDISQRCVYATQLSARWIDFRLRLLGVAMVTCLSLIAVVQHQFSSVSAGLVGLAISYSLSVTNLLGGVVMFFTETEKEFVSVERCQYYIEETPSERWDGALFAPSVWPTDGVVEFEGVSLQYRDILAPALNDVCFKTRPGEKIGIVGRTGAGKSSLFLALFRLVEMCTGRIIVDGVDISHLDLTDIRSRFAAIPQDPFLFSGSIRMNLDPTKCHSDPELWSALDRCHLRTAVDRMGGLEARLTQKGKEFSVGQRQLVCLARAMLTYSKILCIDEATASVDMDTDILIQNTIRQEFKNSTVLTIAHRINTVLDSDRVLVMKDGVVAEFGAPGDLLQNPGSLFYSLVNGNR